MNLPDNIVDVDILNYFWFSVIYGNQKVYWIEVIDGSLTVVNPIWLLLIIFHSQTKLRRRETQDMIGNN